MKRKFTSAGSVGQVSVWQRDVLQESTPGSMPSNLNLKLGRQSMHNVTLNLVLYKSPPVATRSWHVVGPIHCCHPRNRFSCQKYVIND